MNFTFLFDINGSSDAELLKSIHWCLAYRWSDHLKKNTNTATGGRGECVEGSFRLLLRSAFICSIAAFFMYVRYCNFIIKPKCYCYNLFTFSYLCILQVFSSYVSFLLSFYILYFLFGTEVDILKWVTGYRPSVEIKNILFHVTFIG